MKNQILLASLALMGAVAVTSCSNEQSVNQPESIPSNEIRLHVGSVATRAMSDSQNDQLAENNTVGAFAYVEDSQVAITNGVNNKYNVGENGKLTAESGEISTSAESVYVYAYAPYQTDWSSTSNTFTVQSTQNNSLISSDLLYAQETNVTPGTDVELNFKHKLSQLKVKLVNNNSSQISLKQVTLTNVNDQITLDLATGNISDPTGNQTISIFSSTNGHNVDSKGNLTVYGIIVPQTVESGTELVSITTTETDSNPYVAKVTSDVEFESGKTYTMTVNIGEPDEEIEIKFGDATLEGWEEGEIPTDGEKRINLASNTFSTSGSSNCSWSSETNTFSWTQTNSNQMSIYTVVSGVNISDYKTLRFTTAELTSGASLRIGYSTSSSGSSWTMSSMTVNSNGEQTIDISSLSLGENYRICIAGPGNGGTGSGSVKITNVYLSTLEAENN